MTNILIFLSAFTGGEHWRVTYPDGGMTRKMDLLRALECWYAFGGMIWIDYQN